MSEITEAELESAMKKSIDGHREGWYRVNVPGLVSKIESQEKELATAKAENGRLVEVLERCERLYCDKAAERAKLSRDQHDSDCFIRDALSSSNAIDYWQGEIRKAKAEGMLDVRKFIKDWHKPNNQMKLLREQILERASHQSNKAKARRGRDD